jgi:hypothetical protein
MEINQIIIEEDAEGKSTFDKIKNIQKLIKKESALKEICKKFSYKIYNILL